MNENLEEIEKHKEPLLLVIARRYPVHELGLKVLLKHGANVNIQDEYGDTFLHIINKCGLPQTSYHKLLRTILDYSPNLNIQNQKGETPLHILCKEGHSYSVEATLNFISFGSDVNILDNSGKKPLEYLSDKTIQELRIKVSNFSMSSFQ